MPPLQLLSLLSAADDAPTAAAAAAAPAVAPAAVGFVTALSSCEEVRCLKDGA
jgi:hypothetical protein